MNLKSKLSYKSNDSNDNELNFFVNKTNFYAFNALINNDTKFCFYMDQKNQVNHIFSKIWLKKTMQLNITIIMKILNLHDNILIDNLIFMIKKNLSYSK